MGQNNCTPNIPGLENCYARYEQTDENKYPYLVANKHRLAESQNSQIFELYQKQQDQLRCYLQTSRQLSQSTRRNYEFEGRFLKLPSHLICHIMYFVIDDYINLLLVNTLWYTRLNEAFSKTVSIVDEKFQQSHSFLKLKQSKNAFQTFQFGRQQGFRLDRCLIAEIAPGVENSIVKISYTYNCKGQEKAFCYKFGILRKNTVRTIWIGVDQSTNIYDKQTVPVIQPVLPFCVGDFIKIPFTLLNLQGQVNLQSIRWNKPQIEKLDVGIFGNPKHIAMQPPLRFEPKDADWTLFQYFDHPMKKCFDNFKQIKLKECRCCGNGLVINRMNYTCVQEGHLTIPELNMKMVVKQGCITNQVNRATVSYELDNTLELRIGDLLTLYYLRGGDS
ncbi:unnamed protein product [Paramecium octaurelia]|uniref:Uncharacterized protein n=1 Tax=Paramecium octaurelia TaxID=43137 RepID=A0A8S1XUH5_PAROT|nr:unnamed protein product [Paramecium octaurelia]